MLSGRDPQPTKTLQPAQRRVHRIVPSFGTANGIRTARVTGLSRQSIVAAFAVALTNGMDGREVQNIKPHRLNCRQALNYIIKRDRKSTRLNSSHVAISYAVFCLKKKPQETQSRPP